ncbi:hypothetical protein HDU76_000940, partial [Blyttiomyces sp. JEL0837]
VNITTSTTPTTSPLPAIPVGWSTLDSGCLLDGVNGQPRTFSSFLGGGLSVEGCLALASGKGYQYAGLEYGGECWADKVFRNTTSAAAIASDCSFPCNANPAETCGGANRLSAYVYTNPNPPTGITATSASATSSSSPTAVPIPDGWMSINCLFDAVNGQPRTFGNFLGTNLAVEDCLAKASAAGYTLAGLEYGGECWADRAFRNTTSASAPSSDCSFPCDANPAEICGAGSRLSAYQNINTTPNPTGTTATTSANPTSTTIPTPPVVSVPGLPNGWSYVGCFKEGTSGRALAGAGIAAPGGMTNGYCGYDIRNGGSVADQADCTSTCAGDTSQKCGGDGSECYCDDSLNGGGTLAANGDAECANVPCDGNPSEFCGSGGRLATYTHTTPVSIFGTPANTGHYEFFIGGLTVPLLTALTTTNKVVMLERVAGGAPNTTHAYELDYSTNDYRVAFREMHVSTDVFCSAGLMLPDAKGRILNVGGWADVSLEGVRLYTPTGSAGVNGTTDWEEDVAKLHLQVPRWYPSALQLLNGSIAVIGGETNSNGNNQPNVEILPATGTPPITLPLLVNTNPFNLYPHVFTLPSGKVFMAAHNQAQVLDPNTWQTLITLPTLPGAAFSTTGDPNGSGGRTYPMSGTALLLPFSPPYTNPATVLICGGSLGAGGYATDNCVSIQPEVTGATWTIERMPYKRVMPNMVHLPDGTILVLNGCQFGVAGFGLGQNPTLTAILYDPTKPVNSRFSILGSTIVARMYHSEALLLHDGRVLVSGSDPQEAEQGYPEEYRIEVYVPPYLTSGLPRPTFTITSGTDVNFGGQISFTANLPSGGPIRVSLISPGVNTHGNTMGTRFIWLSVTAQVGSYIATSPPGQEIAPANHYLMFVLDGPTPSVGQWIRLGGDPGNLSAWPNLPGFTLP